MIVNIFQMVILFLDSERNEKRIDFTMKRDFSFCLWQFFYHKSCFNQQRLKGYFYHFESCQFIEKVIFYLLGNFSNYGETRKNWEYLCLNGFFIFFSYLWVF